MSLPDIKAVLTASTEGFETALLRAARASLTASDQIKEHTEKINKSYENLKHVAEAAVAFFAVEKFVGLIEKSLEASQKLDRLAQSSGIAVESLGGLGFAAHLADVDIDSAAGSFVKLDKSIAAAAAGNKQASVVYQALGISVRDASGQVKSADQILIEAADKFATYEDGANKTALALALFGKAGAAMIPLLNQGGAAIQENSEYFKKYSGVTEELTRKAAEFEDTQKKIALISGAFGNQLTAALLPALQGIANEFLHAKETGTLMKDLAEDLGAVLRGVAVVATYVAQGVEQLTSRIGALAASAGALAESFTSTMAATSGGEGGTLDPEVTKDQERASAALHAIWEARAEDAARFAERMNALRNAINGKGKEPESDKPAAKKVAAPTIPLADQAKAAVDPLIAYLDGLNKEGLKFKFDTDNFERFKGAAGTSKAALVEFDVVFGKFSDKARIDAGLTILTSDQKQNLIEAGRRVAELAEAFEHVKVLHAFDESVKSLQLQTGLVGQTNEQIEVANRLHDLEKAGIKAGTDEYQKRIPILTEAVHQLALAQQFQQVKAFTFTGDLAHDDALFQLSLIGKTKDQVQDLTAARQIDLEVQRKAFDETGKQQVSDEALGALQAEASRQKAQLAVDNTATREAQRSALTGAKDFFNEYVSVANDAATQVKDTLSDAFRGAEDAFVSFVQTGKVDFKSLVDSIQADILRAGFKNIVSSGLKQAAGAFGEDSTIGKVLSGVAGASGSKGASSALGAAGSVSTTASNAALTTFSATVTAANEPMIALTAAAQSAAAALASVAGGAAGGSTGKAASSAAGLLSDSQYADFGFLESAKGNVFSSGNLIPFAQGGLVSRPTIFPMARGGVGLMGEAGPEAIVPLRSTDRPYRDSRGKLRIDDGSVAAGSPIHVTNNFVIPPGTRAETQMQIGSKAASAVGAARRRNG